MHDAVLEELTEWVVAVLPGIADRIPAAPAAELGRIGVPAEAKYTNRLQAAMGGFRPPRRPPAAGSSGEMPALDELMELGPMVAERLVGALELTIERLDLSGLPDLAAYRELPRNGTFISSWMLGQSPAQTATQTLVQLLPVSVRSVVALTEHLVGLAPITALLVIPAGVRDEAGIAAAHGRAYLALSATVAAAVLGSEGLVRGMAERPAAVVGLGLGVAAGLIRRAPMPPAYGAALLAKFRDEYQLPRSSFGSVPLAGPRFALMEGESFPEEDDFSSNGLVTGVDGGAVVRTRASDGSVRVTVSVLEVPAGAPDELDWDEIVEVSWRAGTGAASVIGSEAPGSMQLLDQTPPWPGDYRLRVHARGRDDIEDDESYKLLVWAAPPAPEIVHRRTDKLGHRLRGEPEPVREELPQNVYRWVERGSFGQAATFSVITGVGVEQVLRGFGADPDQPTTVLGMPDAMMVLDVGSAVVVLEDNGYRGADADVLARTGGQRAASMYWNVNGHMRMSFAEDGRALASFEPPPQGEIHPAVAATLTGMDLNDWRNRIGKGLVAVERFTDYRITAEDAARAVEAGIGYQVR